MPVRTLQGTSVVLHLSSIDVRLLRIRTCTPLTTVSGTGLNNLIATDDPCSGYTPCSQGDIASESTFQNLGLEVTPFVSGYSWDLVANLTYYFVIDGAVLNMTNYFTLHPNPVSGDSVDYALRTVIIDSPTASGKDGTRLFYAKSDLIQAVPCLVQRYYAGNIDKVSPGCFVSDLFLYAGLFVILGLVMVRFVMACVFNWFLSGRLAATPDQRELNRKAISPAVMPEGANISIDNRNGTAPWAGPNGKLNKPNPKAKSFGASASTLNSNDGASPIISMAQIGAELFAVCLVTCYSEGEDSLRTTLDSISRTTYSDARKLLFVVADGIITGAGEKRSTPDICVSLLEADPRFGDPIPMSYVAVGSGAKAVNRAMVYAGHYSTLKTFILPHIMLITPHSRRWTTNPDGHCCQMRHRGRGRKGEEARKPRQA